MAMSVAYGYDIKPQNDDFVSLADGAVSRLSLAVFPGAALVNAVPILRHLPPWFPGTDFHKIASETKEMTTQMKEVPFKWVQKNMACDHLPAMYQGIDQFVIPLRKQEPSQTVYFTKACRLAKPIRI